MEVDDVPALPQQPPQGERVVDEEGRVAAQGAYADHVLVRTELEGDVATYLAPLLGADGYRFTQLVDVITWEVPA